MHRHRTRHVEPSGTHAGDRPTPWRLRRHVLFRTQRRLSGDACPLPEAAVERNPTAASSSTLRLKRSGALCASTKPFDALSKSARSPSLESP